MSDLATPPTMPGDEKSNQPPRPELPKVIQDLFDYPPLLENERQNDLEELFFSFADAVGAKTVIEFQQVYEVTMLVWDIRRYQNLRVLLIGNQKRRAVQNTFKKMVEGESLPGTETLVNHDAARKTEKYFSDSEFHESSLTSFEDADYSIEAEAFSLAMAGIASIDRLIASAQKRWLSFLDNLEKRCAARAEKFNAAAAKVIGESRQR